MVRFFIHYRKFTKFKYWPNVYKCYIWSHFHSNNFSLLSSSNCVLWRKSRHPSCLFQTTAILATLLTPDMAVGGGGGGGFHTKQFCDTSYLSYSLTQFWPMYPETASDPTDDWLSSTRPSLPLQMPILRNTFPGYPQFLFSLATNWRFIWLSPPWTQLLARTSHRTLGNPDVFQFIKRKISVLKGCRWTSRWQKCVEQGIWEGAWSFYAPSQHYPAPAPPRAHQLGAFWAPYFWDLYGDFITKAWWVINSISSPFPLSREREVNWRFQASNHGLIFLGSSLHPEATQSHLSTRHCHPGKSRGLRGCVRIWGQRPNVSTNDAPNALITLDITRLCA